MVTGRLRLRREAAGRRMFYVYILKSERDQKRYVGSTNDLERRIHQHNSGQVSSTKYRQPLVLIYKEKYKEEQDARSRERFFKTHKGYTQLKKLLLRAGV